MKRLKSVKTTIYLTLGKSGRLQSQTELHIGSYCINQDRRRRAIILCFPSNKQMFIQLVTQLDGGRRIERGLLGAQDEPLVRSRAAVFICCCRFAFCPFCLLFLLPCVCLTPSLCFCLSVLFFFPTLPPTGFSLFFFFLAVQPLHICASHLPMDEYLSSAMFLWSQIKDKSFANLKIKL